MTTVDNIEGISVFVKINGQMCVAPIAADSGVAFVGMLSAFQAGFPKETRLIRLPESVAKHVTEAALALYQAAQKKGDTP